MKGRRAPRPAGSAIRGALSAAAPETLLAAVQAAWPQVAGPTILEQAEPVRERDGEITIACKSATWAQELDLLQRDLMAALNAALTEPVGSRLAGQPVRALRFTADAARHRPH